MGEALRDQQSIDALQDTLNLITQEEKTGIPNTEQQIYAKVFSTELDRQRQKLSRDLSLDTGTSEQIASFANSLKPYSEMTPNEKTEFESESNKQQLERSFNLPDSNNQKVFYDQVATIDENAVKKQNPSNRLQDGRTDIDYGQPVNNSDIYGLEKAMEGYEEERTKYEREHAEIIKVLTLPLKPPVRFRDRLSQLLKGNQSK